MATFLFHPWLLEICYRCRGYVLPKATFRLEETVVDLWFVLQWRCALHSFVTAWMKKLCLNLTIEDWSNLFAYSHSVETLLQFLKCRLTALSAMIECLTLVLISPSWETKEFWPGDISCLQIFFCHAFKTNNVFDFDYFSRHNLGTLFHIGTYLCLLCCEGNLILDCHLSYPCYFKAKSKSYFFICNCTKVKAF